MDRLTKTVVLASTVGALAFETVNVGRDLWYLPWLALAAAVAAYGAGRALPERTAGLILAAGAVAPVLFILTTGHFRLWYLSLWVSGLAAATAATTTLTWHYPARLRFPLIAWALAVSLVWPLVALRELDWTPSLLWARPSTISSAIHAIPTSVWIAQVAQVHLLGLLWIDWLFARFVQPGSDRFERLIIWPLFASAILAASFAVYQGFVDLRFLSLGTWAEMGRATGGLADPNPSGSLSALWVSIPIGIVARSRSRRAMILLPIVSVLLLASVWMTGSRTALLGALVGLGASIHVFIIATGRHSRMALATALLVLCTGAALIGLQSGVVGPIQRARGLLPDLSAAAARRAAGELWERNGYGLTAVAMIRDAPLQGIGVGVFHILTVEYAVPVTGAPLPADNAQNWYRHQLAELGVLGSIGWVGWVFIVGAALMRGRVNAEHRTRALALRYAIAGFAAASLLGMPGQSLFVALTLSTFVFWLLLMIDEGSGVQHPQLAIRRRWPQILPLALAIAFAALTWNASWRELRPPFRAKRFDYAYRYGLYDPFEAQSGQTRTSAHAVAVRRAPSRWLKLTVWVEHPDADERPVYVQVWRDHERIMRGRFPRNVPLTRYVTVPGENRSFVLESRVDRTFLPSDGGHGDVGLNMAWEFVDSPPGRTQ